MRTLKLLHTLILTSTCLAQSFHTINHKIIDTIEHDPNLFTQGLAYNPPYLYESSGLYGKSKLTKYHWPSRTKLQHTALIPQIFAEGIAIKNNELLQLTWREHTAIVYDLHTNKPKRYLQYPGEGWGLTSNENNYIMTSGNHCLQHRNPNDFSLNKTVCLTHPKAKSWQLNDITYDQGYIYANIWYQDIIAKINPENGEVAGIIPLNYLRKNLPKHSKVDVLNGITTLAHNTLLITGKYWPYYYIIQLDP